MHDDRSVSYERGALVNSYSLSSWLGDPEDLPGKWNVDSNINANKASAIIPTTCHPLIIRFIAEAAIPIIPIIFTFLFIMPLFPGEFLTLTTGKGGDLTFYSLVRCRYFIRCG